MGFERKTALAHRNNFGNVRPVSQIKYIVLHFTANDGDHDEGNARYFQTERVPHTSAHWFVDDDSVTRSVPDSYTAFAVGGAKYSDCAATGGGRLYGKVTNANSISVELCDTVRDGKYRATEKTMDNAAALCMELMEKYGVDIEHVVRHFDVNGKHCPVYFMDERAWGKFKDRIMLLKYPAGRYTAAGDCYLRSAAGTGKNTVRYASLSDTLKKKCRNVLGKAVFRKGQAFRMTELKRRGTDIWGRTKSGYWVPVVHKGKTRAKQ